MLQSRPPIITIMGHVDHGKTTLLDYIRHTKVVDGEAGGITQHIGAYSIEFEGKPLTFIDTPGHAAFNKMRERGAQVTDIIVLVVAADDGVKPQTIESIRHIKNSTAKVVVAINKIDKDNVYPDMVRGQLAEHGILVSGFGGDIETIELSAKTGLHVEKLLETLVLIAEVEQYQADPNAPLQAVVIEATKDSKRGSVASVIVKQGTLSPRQEIVSPEAEGRVRALVDETGKQLERVLPGFAAEVIGFKDVPAVGSLVQDADRMDNDASAQGVAEESAPEVSDSFAGAQFDDIFSENPKLKLIVKADVEGTLEAITQTLDPESTEVLATGVGEVTDSDLELAHTAGAAIIAFHIPVKNRLKEQAKAIGVKIRKYDIIYKLIEDLQKQMLKLLDSTIDEVVTGEAEILQVFEMRGERIAGVRVKTGKIKKTDKLHLKRGEAIITDLTLKSMQHGKELIDEVNTKNEAGLIFKQNKAGFQVGDILVAYTVEDDLE